MMNHLNLTRNLSALLLLVLFLPVKAQTWNYPVRPETEEWKKLGSFSERLNAFNIPDSILKEMTTQNLVKTCLNYPWWILITSRDNNQIGYNYLKSVFNGFRELENRKDAGQELFKEYEKMEPGNIVTYESLVDQGLFSFRFTFIEVLLSQPSILKNMTNDLLTSLISKTISVYESKSVAFEEYSYYGVSTSCLILSRHLEMKNYTKFYELLNKYPDLKILNNGGVTGNQELLKQIVSESKQILEDNKW